MVWKSSKRANMQISTALPRPNSARFVLHGRIRSHTNGALWDLLSMLPTPTFLTNITPWCLYRSLKYMHAFIPPVHACAYGTTLILSMYRPIPTFHWKGIDCALQYLPLFHIEVVLLYSSATSHSIVTTAQSVSAIPDWPRGHWLPHRYHWHILEDGWHDGMSLRGCS